MTAMPSTEATPQPPALNRAQRRALMQQARDGGNPRHLVAEGYEMGIL